MGRVREQAVNDRLHVSDHARARPALEPKSISERVALLEVQVAALLRRVRELEGGEDSRG